MMVRVPSNRDLTSKAPKSSLSFLMFRHDEKIGLRNRAGGPKCDVVKRPTGRTISFRRGLLELDRCASGNSLTADRLAK